MTSYPPTGSVQYPRGPVRPHRGVMILVFGILSWAVCLIFGILAWVMGNNDLKAMDAGEMDPEGRGLTQAGKIVGMIHVIVALAAMTIALLVMVLLLIVGGFAASSSGP
jgi:hypothetical protein